MNQTDRPRFFEQQYLGSRDLDAVVEYQRMARARHDLGAHSWGIAAGLQLIEKKTKSGVDVYVQPGYAWDGFGRPLTVLAPYKIPSEPFKNIPFTAGLDDGSPAGHLVEVWLAFTATPRGAPGFGFEACSVEEQYARIFESFRLVIGEKPTHGERHAPVTVGQYTVDAEQVPQKLGAATDPPLVDESVGYQSFPDEWDRALWLVPIGLVRWVPPSNPLQTGNFAARDANDVVASDRKRRYAGVVAETVDAALGFVRVRSREAPSYAPTVWNTDAEKNLLWVEGSLRVHGDAKLLDGQLILRDAANGDNGRPLAIRRRATNAMAPAGSDLFAQIGSTETGANRFVVGPVTGNTPADFKERLVVKDDGKVGIGVGNPTAAPLVVRAQGGTEDLIAFETPGGAPTWKLGTLAGGKPGLNFGEAAGDGRLFLQPGGNVGIGTLEPKHRLEIHGEDNALVVVSDATSGIARNAGLELRTKAADGVSYIDFVKGSTDLAISGTPDFSGRLSYNLANTAAFALQGGRVGIDTATPTNQLHVNHNSGLRVNRLYMSGGIGGVWDRWSSISFNAHRDDGNNAWVFPDPANRAVTIEMDDFNGNGRFEVFSTTTAAPTAWKRRLHLSGETGNLVVGDAGGNVGVGLTAPACRLHVQGNITGSADQAANHIALIDNLGGDNADVLALRVGTAFAGNSCNFITFFAGAFDVGAIEGNGLGISLNTTSADYAEWLPRDDGESAMHPGDVVGVFAGRLRRATKGADHVLVISTAPAILANAPPVVSRAGYEKVAMLGQAPVRVRGGAHPGDVIVPSDDADGTGIAVRATDATLEQHASAIGIAWEQSRGDGESQVRCAIGLTSTHVWRSVQRALDAATPYAPSADAEREPAPARRRRPKSKPAEDN